MDRPGRIDTSDADQLPCRETTSTGDSTTTRRVDPPAREDDAEDSATLPLVSVDSDHQSSGSFHMETNEDGDMAENSILECRAGEFDVDPLCVSEHARIVHPLGLPTFKDQVRSVPEADQVTIHPYTQGLRITQTTLVQSRTEPSLEGLPIVTALPEQGLAGAPPHVSRSKSESNVELPSRLPLQASQLHRGVPIPSTIILETHTAPTPTARDEMFQSHQSHPTMIAHSSYMDRSPTSLKSGLSDNVQAFCTVTHSECSTPKASGSERTATTRDMRHSLPSTPPAWNVASPDPSRMVHPLPHHLSDPASRTVRDDSDCCCSVCHLIAQTILALVILTVVTFLIQARLLQ